ncbi:MAG: PKD domain-containing protein [Bacteroidetes bacterium]|nr:PKD domain-containing protein [Bacteroidota bacterium]
MKKLIPTLIILCAVTRLYAQIDMTNGLRAHYVFDGNVADISGNGFGGVLKGAAHTNDERLILNDNNKDNVTLPAEVLNGVTDFTISFKVAFKSFHLAGDNPTNTVVSAWGSALDGIWIDYNKSLNAWRFTINGETVSVTWPVVVESNTYCLFFSRTGDSAKIILDAENIFTFPINTTPLSISNLVIGQHANCTDGCFQVKQCMNGKLENLAFWNRGLNADEIDLGCHIPIAWFSSQTTPCADGTVAFSNTSEHADLYAWDFGDGNTSNDANPVHTYTAEGIYTVTLISTNQWNNSSDTITHEVTVSTAGLAVGISAGGSTTICDGSSVELSATPSGEAAYQWWKDGSPIDGATNETYSAGEAGNYSVMVTSAFGCSGTSDGLEVSVNAAPSASVTPSGAVAVCDGSSQTFTANDGNDLTYQWLKNGNPIPGADGISLTTGDAGNYSVIVTNATGCSAVSANSELVVNANPVAGVSAGGATTFCDGSSVELTASPADAASYQWWKDGAPINGATGQTFVATAAGSYAVNVSSSAGCTGTSDAVEVSVNENPVASISPSGAVGVCAGTAQTFEAGGNDLTYQWLHNGNPIPGATNASYTTGDAGAYSVVVTNTNGCSAQSSTAQLSINANPVASITPDGPTTFCNGNSVDLAATEGNGYTYQWYMDGDEIGGATSSHYSASAAGNYSVTIVSGDGCTGQSESISISLLENPVASMEPAGIISACAGSGQQFTANSGQGLTYQWLVNGDPIPGATSATYSTTESGDYAVVVTGANGCSTTSAATSLTINANPEITITSNGNPTLCEGGSVELVANGVGDLEYQWKYNGDVITGATNDTYVASDAGTYTVKVTDTNGCKNAADPITVIVNPNPIANISPAEDISFCAGNTQLYSANDGIDLTYQWTWNGEPIDGATSISYEAGESGAYAVIVTNSSNCTASSSVSNLTVNALPEAAITPDGSTEFCDGGNVMLNASSGDNNVYVWFMNDEEIAGATSDSYSATTSGTYYVVITDGNGCKNASGEVAVTVNENPVASIDPAEDVSFCEGGSQVYSANSGNGLTYQWTWNGEPIDNATGMTYEATATGTYAVIVTNSSGCSTTSSASSLTVNANPEANIDPNGSTTLCAGESVELNANTGNELSYQWQMNGEDINGATGDAYAASEAGSYTVVVTNGSGCQSTSESIQIAVNPLPVVSLGNDTTVCDTSNFELNAGEGFVSYTWNTDEHTQTITPDSTDYYWVVVEDANGCMNVDTVHITVDICTGFQNIVSANSITIYPNPAFGLCTLSIDMPGKDDIRVDLLNTLGQVVLPVYEGQLPSNFTTEVDMKDLSKGVYYIRLLYHGQVQTKKVVNAE